MKKVLRIMCALLLVTISCFSFAGCVETFPSGKIEDNEYIRKMMNDAMEEAKTESARLSKENYNGIKVLYIPSEPTQNDVLGEFSLLTTASQTILTSLKEAYGLEIAHFWWGDGASFYELSKEAENHFYLTYTPTNSNIKFENSSYQWFNGSTWVSLSSVEEEQYHYTYTSGSTTLYFYINPTNLLTPYYYNTTQTYNHSASSLDLILFKEYEYFYIYTGSETVEHPIYLTDSSYSTIVADLVRKDIDDFDGQAIHADGADETNLIVDQNHIVTTYTNKLVATFVNNILNLSGAERISTANSIDGNSASYKELIRSALQQNGFEYFGLKDSDLASTIVSQFLKQIYSGFSDENITLALASAKTALKTELYGDPASESASSWIYNVHILNATVDSLEDYFLDQNKYFPSGRYLSIIYMNKAEMTGYGQDASKNLFPDEHSFYYSGVDELYATFSFKAKDGEEFSYAYNTIDPETGTAYKDSDGKTLINFDLQADLSEDATFNEMKNAVGNKFELNEAFTQENDETAFSATVWDGDLGIYNGLDFNHTMISSLNAGSQTISYVSSAHDVMQVVFTKTESEFALAGIGNMAFCDESQIDWDQMKEAFGEE